jgi:serine phosphatase RsbU (regulator of sigma subunit)/anti-sigma regulatory factor (Ser/Thr protein kinase)
VINLTRTFRRAFGGRGYGEERAKKAPATAGDRREASETRPIDIRDDDPLLRHFQETSGAVALDELELDSDALRALRAAGVRLVVPLISQGELIGLLNLGARLSEQEYSADDRQLLEKLATQAAPAVRVAQLVQEQQAEVRARERLEQELRVAHLIQLQFLPKKLPELPGWQVAAFYRAAREVGGDFYDFIELPDDRIGVVVGDVTGKGVPAALVMATTRSMLRTEAPRLLSPRAVLERANDLLHEDIPPNMFVTCLFGVLHWPSGRFIFANAGHNLPCLRTERGEVTELRATGMPLGLMPGMRYEERAAVLGPRCSMLLYSDGLAEAHGTNREMFGFPRVREVVGRGPDGQPLIGTVLDELRSFTGAGWEQEDDVTLVTISRSVGVPDRSVLAEFTLPSVAGNEREAMERVAAAVRPLGLPQRRLERLKTAVAEATMNAIEYGNEGRADVPVRLRVLQRDDAVVVQVTDQGGLRGIPEPEPPDIEAKLAGLQKPRGWGLFLIKNMVDEFHVRTEGDEQTVELVMRLGIGSENVDDAR